MKGAAKVKRKRYKKQILDKISNLSPEESKEFWKILISIDKKNENCEDRSINDLNSLAISFGLLTPEKDFSKLVIPNSIILS
jgi:hypothetical protein